VKRIRRLASSWGMERWQERLFESDRAKGPIDPSIGRGEHGGVTGKRVDDAVLAFAAADTAVFVAVGAGAATCTVRSSCARVAP
jgi:hypothetical protein